MSKMGSFQNPLETSGDLTSGCRRQLILPYVRSELSGNLLLEFLLHVDECQKCRNAVLEARKAQHPEFYGVASSKSFVLLKEE